MCLYHRSYDLFSTNYCCSTLPSHTQRQICDICVHYHIKTKLYSCLTSCIICPELNCSSNLSPSVICHILLKYESNQLLNNYLSEQQWQGKSNEWIKRFTIRCPGCNVPIEKDGGCDEMICINCQTHFYWSKAKQHIQEDKKETYQFEFDWILLLIFLLFLILSTIIYYK